MDRYLCALVTIAALFVVGCQATSPGATQPSPSAQIASPTTSAVPSATSTPTDQPAVSPSPSLPIALEDADTGNFKFLFPSGWTPFAASAPEASEIVQALREAQGDENFLAGVIAAQIELAAEFGGAFAFEPESQGVEGTLAIVTIQDAPDPAHLFIEGRLEALEAESQTEFRRLATDNGTEALATSATMANGAVMHLGAVIGEGAIFFVDYVTSDPAAGSPVVFDAILRSIEPVG